MLLRSLLSLIAVATLAAQSQAPDFEVVSVKRSPPLSPPQAAVRAAMGDMTCASGGPGSKNPRQIDYTECSLRTLLARAYGLKAYQVVGPAWLDQEFYYIAAKLPPGTTKEQLSLMLQRLLAERFHIVSHRESRQMRVYTLSVATGGPKLKPAEPGPAPAAAGQSADPSEMKAVLDARLKTAMERRRANTTVRSSLSFWMSEATVTDLAQRLSRRLNAPVIDQTGIEGKYAIDLKWGYDDAQKVAVSSNNAPFGPSLSTAIREQLGLKLVAGKVPVEVLVIDKAEKKPTGT